MNRTQKTFGFALLVVFVAVVVIALAGFAPALMASVGWHDIVSVGWHDLCSVGWVPSVV